MVKQLYSKLLSALGNIDGLSGSLPSSKIFHLKEYQESYYRSKLQWAKQPENQAFVGFLLREYTA